MLTKEGAKMKWDVEDGLGHGCPKRDKVMKEAGRTGEVLGSSE